MKYSMQVHRDDGDWTDEFQDPDWCDQLWDDREEMLEAAREAADWMQRCGEELLAQTDPYDIRALERIAEDYFVTPELRVTVTEHPTDDIDEVGEEDDWNLWANDPPRPVFLIYDGGVLNYTREEAKHRVERTRERYGIPEAQAWEHVLLWQRLEDYDIYHNPEALYPVVIGDAREGAVAYTIEEVAKIFLEMTEYALERAKEKIKE